MRSFRPVDCPDQSVAVHAINCDELVSHKIMQHREQLSNNSASRKHHSANGLSLNAKAVPCNKGSVLFCDAPPNIEAFAPSGWLPGLCMSV